MSCTVLVLGAEGTSFSTSSTRDNLPSSIGILFLRVYAFSGRSKRLLAYLVLQFCVSF